MSSEKEMYPYVYNLLRRRYPLNEGWEITEQHYTTGTYIPDFVVSKNGKLIKYVVPVEVKYVCKATQAHINQLNSYASKLAGGKAVIQNKILVYPSGADVTLVPSDIDCIFLNSFSCNKSK